MNREHTHILTDQFGRFHNYLRISLTELCNLRCFYCMPEEGIPLRQRSEFMSREEILTLAGIFVNLGVSKIRLTGGEPLVRKDAGDIIQDLSRLPIELGITTNGYLLDRYLDLFIASGLRSVNISLDSLDEDKFNRITRRSYFHRIFSNIESLIDHDFHVKLNAVIIKGTNDNELIDFIEFTKDLNVHFRFIEFMPFSGNNWDWEKGVSYREMIKVARKHYGSLVKRIDDKKHDTAKNYRIEGYKGTFAVISSVTNPFCDTCNRLRLTADGKLKNCLFSNAEMDLLTPLRRGENVIPLIRKSVWTKEEQRGGMKTFEEYADVSQHHKNRAMVAIGG